jgi:hypothetical protein
MKVPILVSVCLLAGACSTTHGSYSDAEAASAKAKFATLVSLAGEWSGNATGDGQTFPMAVRYRLTANGSVVEETLFPGTPHEMVTMYHLDGDRLMLTHYCSAGNQPRMVASTDGDAKTLEFDFIDGTNMKSTNDMHMHAGKIVVKDADHIQSSWQGWQDGKLDPSHVAQFEVTRQR